MSTETEEVFEARQVTRVDSKGNKTRKVKCPKGYKLSASGKSCVPITGKEKADKKKSLKRAVRTKKSKGDAYKKRTTRKRLKAMKKRKNYGL